MEECLHSLMKFLWRKVSEVGVHQRTRRLDMMIDSMFVRNMRKLTKFMTKKKKKKKFKVFLLRVLEL